MNTHLTNYLLLICLFTSSQVLASEPKFTLGVKLLGAGWQGDNGGVSDKFNSDEGGQLALSASFSRDKFYTGISIQGGNYTFNSSAPDKFTPSGRISNSNVEIKQQEMDLLAGYYVWSNVSLFADIKVVSNTWSDDSYKQNFSGLGLGASGFIPLAGQWTGFATVGFIFSGEIKDDNKSKVGDGNSSALELAAIYRLSDVNSLNMGIKFRNYSFEYLDNSSQDYSVNALFFGYNHSF